MRKYTRSVARDGNLYPSAFDALHALPAHMSHQAEHNKLRAPLATFNLSFGRALDAFVDVLDHLDELASAEMDTTGTLHFDPKALLDRQKELLDAMASHIDEGYLVLKAIYSSVNLKRDQPFADRWLEEAGHRKIMRIYKDAVAPYRDSFIQIVNDVKHNAGRLRICVLWDNHRRLGGYYLETSDRNGAPGPDPTMHPDNTAFSFNRDLRHHFCHLYDIGDALKRALVQAASTDYRTMLALSPVAMPDERLANIAERVSKLGLWFFPDEVQKATPIVEFKRTDSDTILSVDETRNTVPFTLRSFKATIQTTGDGVTRTWRFPYMQYAIH
jgi:hypothetical protein